MKKLLCLLCFCMVSPFVFSQTIPIDSAKPRIEAEKNDSARARLVWYALGTSETNPVLDMMISEKLLIHAQKRNDKLEEVFALACMGYDYRAFGDNTKSLQYNVRANVAAEQTANTESKAMAKLCIALNYQDLGDYPKAISLNLSALEYASKTNFFEVMTVSLIGLGDTYLSMNKVDSALIYTQRAFQVSTKAGYKDYLAAILGQLGSIHTRMGNPQLAITHYDMAIQEAARIGSPKYISSFYTAKAQFYHDAGQRDSSLLYAKKAIDVVQNTAFSTMSITPAKLLLDVYRGNNVDSAFKYSEIFRIANDSLFNIKTLQQAQLMTFEEDARQQQLAAEQLKASEERSKNIQYVLITLAIVSFIILYLLLSRRFITNTKLIEFLGVLALLIIFEFLNLLLHPYLEKLTHHSPTLMLVCLVAVAALLIPLHHRIEKWATARIIEKNKEIRLAAAKKTIAKLEGGG